MLHERLVSRTSLLTERDVRTLLMIPARWVLRDEGERTVYKGEKRGRCKLAPSVHRFSAGWLG